MVSVAPHLRYLIFYVTSRCNLRCDHCFYVDELRACDELTLTEIRRVARSVCPLEFVRITGGEPFLRSDLPLVVEAFVRESGVRRIGIITNGTLPDLTASTVEEILLRCPSVELDVGVSVDGLRETHDRLRNRSGVFDQCRATVRHLLRLRALLAGLRVSVVVTVSSANVRELDELYDELSGWGAVRISPNSLRGRVQESSLKPVSFEMYERFALKCETYHRAQDRGLRSVVQRAKNRLSRRAIREILAGQTSSVPCLAGTRIGVLYPDGVVSVCEPLFHQAGSGSDGRPIDPVLGNVRETGGDLSSLWQSERAAKARKWIVHSGCSCTHECFLTASILWGPRNYPGLLRESVHEGVGLMMNPGSGDLVAG